MSANIDEYRRWGNLLSERRGLTTLEPSRILEEFSGQIRRSNGPVISADIVEDLTSRIEYSSLRFAAYLPEATEERLADEDTVSTRSSFTQSFLLKLFTDII